MDDHIRDALAAGRTIDITTKGRKTGEPRRKEIWYHVVEERIYITGLPGRRGWYANLRANPSFTFHVKEGANADLPARAVAVDDPDERRRILGVITTRLGHADLDDWVERSPLVEVVFAG